MQWIVFFDGKCGLCVGLIRFIAHADHRHRLRFAPLQGETAATRRLSQHADPENGTMVVWRETDRALFLRSDAILELTRALGGFWSLLHLLRIVPRSWREGLYCYVARNRIRWFGNASACVPLDERLRSRLLP